MARKQDDSLLLPNPCLIPGQVSQRSVKQKVPPWSAAPAAARGPTPPLESTRRLMAARSREAVEKGRGSDKECMMVVSDPLKGHLALGSASPGMQRLAFKSSPSPPPPIPPENLVIFRKKFHSLYPLRAISW